MYMTFPYTSLRKHFTTLLVMLAVSTSAQTSSTWTTSGNAAGSSSFLGTTNNEPLIFKTNNAEAMRIKPNGEIKLSKFETAGKGLVTVNNGIMGVQPFPDDTNLVLCGSGGFKSMATLSGWTRAGATVYNATGVNVGIGTVTPQGKLDVNGDVFLRGKTSVYRIVSTNGDSIVRFGDSTLYINYGNGTIYNSGPVQGIGIGQFTSSVGFSACAIGYRVHATQTASIAIGAGSATAQFLNTTPYSLAVAFNSNIASFFVGSSNGNGTVGKVGVGTSAPRADFQVGQGFSKLCVGSTTGAASNYSTSYVGFNAGKQGANDWVIENDFSNNGASVIMGDIFGDLRFINIPTSGATNRNFTDHQMQDYTSMRIRRDGRVIIGKQTQVGGPYDNPNNILTVNGGIICQRLNVTMSNWADSVLAPEYRLMSLDSVSLFIQANGHLPGMPSEDSVKTSGVDLAQNDVLLLAKIEELTLYLLELREQNNVLQKRVVELENKANNARE